MRAARKEIRPLIRRIVAAGAEVRPGGKHPKVYKDGRFICTLPATASDHRSLKNTEKQLERMGVL